jgi:hypothetical protein
VEALVSKPKQYVSRKAVEAIQFNGNNGREVAEFMGVRRYSVETVCSYTVDDDGDGMWTQHGRFKTEHIGATFDLIDGHYVVRNLEGVGFFVQTGAAFEQNYVEK